MGIPAKLVDFLAKNNVKYEVIPHSEAFTAQELAAIEHVKGRYHAKVVMVKANSSYVMAVLAADHRVNLECFEKILGKRSALASEEEFASLFPDCNRGAMPPFGNLYGVPTYVDRSLTRNDFIVFEAGTHTNAIKMGYADYARLVGPTEEDFAVKPIPPEPSGRG